MEEMQAKVEQSLIKRFKKELFNNFCKAIDEYDLIQAGDKIAVCISGGKDSMLMAKLFQELQRRWVYRENRVKKNDILCSVKNDNNNDKNNKEKFQKIDKNKDKKHNFELVFLVMDPGYNKANRDLIEQNAKQLGVPITIFETDIFNSVVNVEKSPCYLCARMRRGYLYSKAQELGCNKIALGHHYNDVIETILMGMLFSGQFQTMLPKLNSTNFKGMQLIRPMYLIKEKDILHWKDYCGLKFLQCACRFTEQTNYSSAYETNDINKNEPISAAYKKNKASISENEKMNAKIIEDNQSGTFNLKEETSMRKFTKQLIDKLSKLYPQIETNIFKSVENVNLSTLISYKDKFGTHSFKDNF